MIGIQILAILFALWMTYFTFLHYRRKEFSRFDAFLWQVLWVGLIAVVIFPGSVRFILRTFSITRTFDLIVIVGIMALIGMTFRNYVIIKRLERRIEEDVRREAMESSDR